MDIRKLLTESPGELEVHEIESIVASGAGAVEELLAVFADEDLHAEDSPGEGLAPVIAAQLLGQIADPRAVQPLLEEFLLGDIDSLLFSAAAQALPRHGETALSPLLTAYDEALDDDEVRRDLARLLAELGVRDERIYERLERSFPSDVAMGAGSFVAYGDPRAVPLLEQAFDDYDVPDPGEQPFGVDPLHEMAHAIQKLGGALSAERTAKLEDAKAAQDAHRAQFGGPFDEAPAIPDELLRVLSRTFDGRHGRRSLWNARGFVTAIASTPSLVSPGEWLSVLADLEASTLEESREQIGPMIQLYGLTQEALEDASTGLCPEPDEVEAIEAFCAGYVGAASRDPRWTGAPQAMEAMGPLLVLAGKADFTDDEGNPVSDDDTLEYARESLPESLLLVHAALEPERERAAHEAAAASTPHRRGPKVGRNDPCTCGSGKKYKRCCGRPGQN